MLGKFWLKMGGLFGHTWASQYGDSPAGDAGDTWAAALAMLSGEQVALGLRETLKLGSDWPPSAPRFRALCLQIPTLGAVRHDLRNETRERMPFTRLAWEYLDGYRFARLDQAAADRTLRDAYELARDYVMAGGRLPDPVPALEAEPQPAPTLATMDQVKNHLAGIAETLGVNGP